MNHSIQYACASCTICPQFLFYVHMYQPKGVCTYYERIKKHHMHSWKGFPFFFKCLIYCEYSFLHLTACDVRLLQPDKATTRGVNSKLYGPSREIVIHTFFLFILKVLKYMPSTQFSFLMLFD